MCRSKVEAGRRCPSCLNPTASRKEAKKAADRIVYARKLVVLKKSISEKNYQGHLNYAQKKINELVEAGYETYKTHGNGADDASLVWSSERRQKHQEIIQDIVSSWDENNVPCEHKAIIAGGLGGAGKSTVLNEHAGIETNKNVVLNPDDLKEKMAEKGMIPSVPALSPMESSPLIHEEASYLTKVISKIANAQGRNIIWDITMASKSSTMKKIDELNKNGYHQNIENVFVDIPIEESKKRSEFRHRQGFEDYLKGEGYGGRIVPEQIYSQQVSKNPEYRSKNYENFKELAEQNTFSQARVFDNSKFGHNPVLIQSYENGKLGKLYKRETAEKKDNLY